MGTSIVLNRPILNEVWLMAFDGIPIVMLIDGIVLYLSHAVTFACSLGKTSAHKTSTVGHGNYLLAL